MSSHYSVELTGARSDPKALYPVCKSDFQASDIRSGLMPSATVRQPDRGSKETTFSASHIDLLLLIYCVIMSLVFAEYNPQSTSSNRRYQFEHAYKILSWHYHREGLKSSTSNHAISALPIYQSPSPSPFWFVAIFGVR